MLYIKEKKKIEESVENISNESTEVKEESKTIDEGIQPKKYKTGDEIEYTLKEGDNIPENMKLGDKIKGKITKLNDGKADIEWSNKEKDTDFDLSKI